MEIRIATRKSRLARTQAEWVAARLTDAGHNCAFVPVSTQGDRDQNRGVSLADSSAPGVFTREVEAPLLSGDADIAVHSLKDLPIESRPGLVVAAIPLREDARDFVIAAGGRSLSGLDDLAPGSRIATSSPRREALLRSLRPDLTFIAIRGNVETRLKKVDEGLADATLLACAGLNRLGIDRPGLALPLADFPCAPAQGALGIQAGNDAAAVAVRVLDDVVTRRAVTAERTILGAMGGGCHLALGAAAWPTAAGWELSAFAELEARVRRASLSGPDLDLLVSQAIALLGAGPDAA